MLSFRCTVPVLYGRTACDTAALPALCAMDYTLPKQRMIVEECKLLSVAPRWLERVHETCYKLHNHLCQGIVGDEQHESYKYLEQNALRRSM